MKSYLLMPENILIIEKHPALLDALRDWVEYSFPEYLVNATNDYSEAILQKMEELPKLVVLDFSMPWVVGEQVIRSIKTRSPDTKILILTLIEDENYRVAFESAGVNAQISKNQLATALIPTMIALLSYPNCLDN